MANKDIAIPIVFPDYLIHVDTPPVKFDLPFVGNAIGLPATKQKLPYLGHAGILFIDGSKGVTKYFEYGRYDPAAKGLVRSQMISDVKIGTNGRPTNKSLAKVLTEISIKSGQKGRIDGA